MIFAATDEQGQVSDTLRLQLMEKNGFVVRRQLQHTENPSSVALWPHFAEAGVISAAFDAAYGGFAGDARTVAVIMSELGISLTVEPYLATAVIVGRLLQHWVARDASSFISRIIAGDAICVLAHDSGVDPFAMPHVVAESADTGCYLSGHLRCVRHADVATSFLVPAILEDVIRIYQVPFNASGLSVSTYRLMDGAGAGDMHLDRVPLPPYARMEFDVGARIALQEAVEWGLLGLAAETAGIVTALNQATIGFLKSRRQFGVPISSFQALRHRAADMHIAAEEIVAAVDAAIELFVPLPCPTRSAAVSTAKVVADVAGRRIGHEAVQLHGGMGVSDDLNISHYARRLTVIRSELGSADIHRLRFLQMQ
jgi:alkylation response protein AidB-like acyl-CoA dehydrogenase